SDALLHFLTAGMDADDSIMIGSGAPIIRVTVAEEALQTGVGFGRIDGQDQPISLDTVRRLMETGKVIRVGFDPAGGYIEQSEDPAAENRLYNAKQREILATKFGGCMDPACERPPSWAEAHHIRQVKRDGGKTTIQNAILLCKYHHLLYHNRGYEIALHDDGSYWKIPPKSVDPDQTPIPMPLKTRNLNDLRTAPTRTRTPGRTERAR
ncbi:MAG TPA: HNH endonuclease signature motif containing protein, partial [Galbitalea sp.]|nr:HNH endonuclease signature motif containing protein [Galbitalea sp.]